MKNRMKSSTLFVLAVFAVMTFFLTAQPRLVHASTAGASASFRTESKQSEADNRAQVLRDYLNKYNSPLADEAETFVVEADKYNLDYRLLPAIAGVESWFGTRLPRNSYNAWGWGIYGGKVRYFASWEDGVQTISQDLRVRFMDRWGARSISEIGSRYASDPKWTAKVMRFVNEIEAFEDEAQTKAISISL